MHFIFSQYIPLPLFIEMHHIVSNQQRIDRLLNRLFRRRSKETSKLCVNGLCEGNPPVTGGKCFHLMTSSWTLLHNIIYSLGLGLLVLSHQDSNANNDGHLDDNYDPKSGMPQDTAGYWNVE